MNTNFNVISGHGTMNMPTAEVSHHWPISALNSDYKILNFPKVHYSCDFILAETSAQTGLANDL